MILDCRFSIADFKSKIKNQKSKIESILFLFMLSLLLVGCGEDEGKIRVGVSVQDIAHPGSRLIELALKENAGKYGARILYEQEGLTELLTRGIDVLILNRSDPGELESSVKDTHHRNIPVVVLDCPPPRNLHVEACVMVNQFETGRMAADYMVRKLGGKGNVIILEGPRNDETSRQITLGMYSVLEQHESIRIVADELHPDWDERMAAGTVRSTLGKYADNIQAVLAGSSQLAMGAVRASLERRLADRILTAGIGADLTACRAIIAGVHDVEVDRNAYGRGLEALSLAVAIAKDEDFAYDEEVGEYDPKIKVRFGPLRLITRENVSVMNITWPELADKR